MTMAMVTPLCRDTRTHGLVLVRSLSGVLPCGTPMPGSVATSCSVTSGVCHWTTGEPQGAAADESPCGPPFVERRGSRGSALHYRKARVLDLRKWMRPRDRLSAGGK